MPLAATHSSFNFKSAMSKRYLPATKVTPSGLYKCVGLSIPFQRGENEVTVMFHGVRGSTACHGRDTQRYGGNTSCVSMDIGASSPIIFDLGTGLRYLKCGEVTAEPKPFVGACLLTHLHWDHTQGLPFFKSLLHHDTVLDIYAPRQPDGTSLHDAFIKELLHRCFRFVWTNFRQQLIFTKLVMTTLKLVRQK